MCQCAILIKTQCNTITKQEKQSVVLIHNNQTTLSSSFFLLRLFFFFIVGIFSCILTSALLFGRLFKIVIACVRHIHQTKTRSSTTKSSIRSFYMFIGAYSTEIAIILDCCGQIGLIIYVIVFCCCCCFGCFIDVLINIFFLVKNSYYKSLKLYRCQFTLCGEVQRIVKLLMAPSVQSTLVCDEADLRRERKNKKYCIRFADTFSSFNCCCFNGGFIFGCRYRSLYYIKTVMYWLVERNRSTSMPMKCL